LRKLRKVLAATGSIIGMTQTPNANVGARLHLKCRRHHEVGTLWMKRPNPKINYRRQAGPPELWPRNRADFYSEPRCPGGCGYEVGAPANVLVQRVIELAENPNADEATFVLINIGPAKDKG
jgi:hypothetical protein